MYRRFKTNKVLIPVAVLALILAGVAAASGRLVASPPGPLDDLIRLEFVVLDDETSLPIQGAAVRLFDPFGSQSDCYNSPSFSDERGTASHLRDFDLGQILNEVKDGNGYKVFGWRLQVSAEGYQTSTTPLFEHTGAVIDPRNPKVKHPNVRLHRVVKAELKDDRQAEIFVFGEFFRRCSLVFYGDKFDALRSWLAPCSHATPCFEAKHGSVTESGGVLRLHVEGQEILRGRNAEANNWLAHNLIRVNWGQRQYLVDAEQRMAFCNAVNQGKEPRESEFGDFALAKGQEKIAVSGLPNLPAPWAEYLLKTPVRCEVTELLPDLKAKINVGRNEGLKVGMELVPTVEYLFSEMEIVSVDAQESVIRTKYPDGRYRKIRVGDVVSTRRPPSRVKMINLLSTGL
jgi:hypothetical protein